MGDIGRRPTASDRAAVRQHIRQPTLPQRPFERVVIAIQAIGDDRLECNAGFPDYDPSVMNADGSKGNIVPKVGPTLLLVPKDEALLHK
jgi:hypothetical protein